MDWGLEVTINESANILPPDSYTSLVALSTGAQENGQTVQVNLNVEPLPCEFKVTERDPLKFRRDNKGNFVNNRETIEISNAPDRKDCIWAAPGRRIG